jgi:hypothetical protein
LKATKYIITDWQSILLVSTKKGSLIMKPDETRIINPTESELKIIPNPTIEITQDEYEILLEKATELDLLKRALYEIDAYSTDIKLIKAIFGIAKKGE